VVFFTTLILLSVIIFVCAGIFVMLLRNTYSVNRIKYGTQAYFLAEAGIEEAIKKFNEEGFNPSGYPKTAQPLGNGTYTVSIQAHADPKIKLITSTGAVKTVSRTIYVQIYNSAPQVFDYAALGGGKLTVAGGSVVSDTVPISVHSNNPGNGSVTVGDKAPPYGLTYGRIEGNASAMGTVVQYGDDFVNNVITGTIHDKNHLPVSAVAAPPFTDSFFQYYYNLALADNNPPTKQTIFSGNTTFSGPGDPLAGTTNHVVYVDGAATLEGTWSMTGCIVSTKKMYINDTANGHITQHQFQNLPAFMSRKDVEIYGPTDIEGLVYADGWIKIAVPPGNTAGEVTNVYGTLYGTNWVNLASKTLLHYRRPNPPGLPTSSAVTILSWNE